MLKYEKGSRKTFGWLHPQVYIGVWDAENLRCNINIRLMLSDTLASAHILQFNLSDLCEFLANHVTLWYKKNIFKHFRKQQTASLNRRRRQRGYENYLFTKKYVLI